MSSLGLGPSGRRGEILDVVAVGASLGGLDAVRALLRNIPEDFPAPIVIAQHRMTDPEGLLVDLLAGKSRLPVLEPDDKEPILRGHVYVAPPEYHLIVERGYFALSTDEPVVHARPSIDVLFESAAEAYGEAVVGVLLTGMSRDGTYGLKRIRECGGYALVQDPKTAEGRVMPQAAIESEVADRVLPLEEIAAYLMDLSVGQRMKA